MQWILHLQMEGTSPRHEGHWDLHGSGLYDPPLRERKRGRKEQQPGRRQQAGKAQNEGLTSLNKRSERSVSLEKLTSSERSALSGRSLLPERSTFLDSYPYFGSNLSLKQLHYTYTLTLLWHPIIVT